MIKLRYHHLLCINYFKGYGYDEDFINNMKKIKAKIDEEEIFITDGFDDLCSHCSNKINDKCKWEEKVKRYDNNLKRIINLEVGTICKYGLIKEKIAPVIKSDMRMHVCDDCEWSKYCK